MSEEKTNINIVVPVELKKEIEKRASELGMSMSSYIRFILISDLKK